MGERTITIFTATLLIAPAIASGQDINRDITRQTTDNILWPATGQFPAYPREIDQRRWQFSLSGGVYHDSNLFRLSDTVDPQSRIGSTHKSDTIGRIGLGLKGDLPISQQRLLINAQVDEYKFDRFDNLDHLGYSAGAKWLWHATSRASGDVGYQRQRYLAPFSELQAPIKDLITVDHGFGNAGFMMTPRWRIRGGLDWYKYDHGDPTVSSADNRTTSVTAGLDYVTPPGNYVGGQIKYTDGEYPNLQVVSATLVDNQYKETEASAVAHWVVTGKSTVDGRLGYTRRTHDQVPQRDFSGITGRVSYDWTPGAKTLLNFSAWREIQAYQYAFASYVLSKGASFGPNWAPTSKVVVQPKLVYEKRNFLGDPGIVLQPAPQVEDTFRGLYLSVGYTPRRYLEFSVSGERGKRTSNTVGRDFDYNAVFANAKLAF